MPHGSRRSLVVLLACAAVVAIVFAFRITAPLDILADHQLPPAEYVNDAVVNGNWIVMQDTTGEVMSKPPMHTWLAALVSLPAGHATYLSLYLPCVIAMGLTGWLIYLFGRGPLGERAAILSAGAFLLTPAVFKHVATARTDALFTLMVALMALLVHRAWTARSPGLWLAAWSSGALVILTKGPLGVVLALLGLLAFLPRFGRDAARRSRPSASPGAIAAHVAGWAVLLGVPALWFWLAHQHLGDRLIDKMIGRELLGHAVEDDALSVVDGVLLFARRFVTPSLYFLHIMAPASLAASVGLVRLWKAPAQDERARCFLRFCFFWFVGGLLIFSVSPHQRRDLLMPLLPAAAVLAGWALEALVAGWSARRRRVAGAGAIVAMLAFAWVYSHPMAEKGESYHLTRAGEALSAEFEPVFEQHPAPVLHLGGSALFQFARGTADPVVEVERAVEALAGEARVYVAAGGKYEELAEKAGAQGIALRVAAEHEGRVRTERVVTNRELSPG